MLFDAERDLLMLIMKDEIQWLTQQGMAPRSYGVPQRETLAAGRSACWICSGLLFAEKRFRRIDGYRELPRLIDILDVQFASSKSLSRTA